MIFLPIGHDQAIRRFPWLTVAIMAICVLFQLHRTFLGPSMEQAGAALDDRERAELTILDRIHHPSVPGAPASLPGADNDEEYLPTGPTVPAASDVPALTVPPDLTNATDAQLLAAARAGRIGDPNDPSILALKSTDARVDKILDGDLAHRFGYRPTDGASPRLLLAAFVHGGYLHLAGNLLFLWLCGCNLEDRWGRPAFAALYVLAAIASSFAYGVWHPGSSTPLIGASGAIAGAMGAFLVCFHAAQIKYWWWYRFKSGIIYLPAYVAFPVWFLSQLAQSFLELSGYDEIAYSAHVGGFAFGAVFALVVRASGIEKKILMPALEKDAEWVEDPDYARALELAGPDPQAAIALMRTVLAKDPKRDDVRLELCRLALVVRDAELVDATATRTFLYLGETSRWHEVVELYRALEGAFEGGLAKPLSDRAYSLCVRAAVEANDPKLCVRVATRMQSSCPQSPLMPRAMWDVATAQATVGRNDLAKKTLSRLVEGWPEHTFATEARRKLQELTP